MLTLLGRIWFNALFIACMLVFAATTRVVHASCWVLRVQRETAEVICVICASWIFWWFFTLNPHISIAGRREIDFDALRSAVRKEGIIACCNHSSFLDPFVFISQLPGWLVWERRVRCLMAERLFEYPVVGTSMGAHLGSFKVFFKSVDPHSESFSVDRDAQQAEQVKVDSHLRRGGLLVVCPEGTVSDVAPKLRMFRRGAFAMALEHASQIWCIAMLGNHVVWPKRVGWGGFAATIRLRTFFPVAPDATKKGGGDAGSSEELAAKVQQAMADALEGMIREESG